MDFKKFAGLVDSEKTQFSDNCRGLIFKFVKKLVAMIMKQTKKKSSTRKIVIKRD